PMSRRKPQSTSLARRPPQPEPEARREPRGVRGWRLAALGSAAALLLLALGAWLGAGLVADAEQRRCAERYRFINTAFACGVRPILGKGGYVGLRTELLRLAEAEAAAGRASSIAIFFRDLRNGPIFGVNELSSFAPASLLKLPLVLAYMNAEENVPGFIERKVSYSGGIDAPEQTIPAAESVQPGREYALQTLLRNTLVHSDNVSYLILRQYVRELTDGEALVEQTYRELGIIPPEAPTDQTVSVQGYASLFRQLHNATYLRPDLSELVLSWLAQSEFRDGLVAGVPAGVVVAHKFGERVATGADGEHEVVEFHDCGIVYYPDNPYVLCVMTRGRELGALVQIVRGISKRVYDEVDGRRAAPTGAAWGAG
ncbi:MAG: serine hydrolase, partial [Thermodesulfobacteriota bacterium]